MSSRSCVVCGGLHAASRLPGLLKCRSCGFSTADLEISTEELESLYTAKYFAGLEYKDYVAEQALIEKQFRVRLATLLRYVPDAASKRLFEIGSAYGFFLSVARSKFLSVEGIDISRDAATYARERLGFPVHVGDFLDFDLEHNLDVVCLWDTIEHLKNPDLYLEKIAGNMNRGGVIAITTGDIGSFVAHVRGSKWRQIHPPTHLHYFSKSTLTKLLEKYGFTVLSCGHEGVYRSMDTSAYIILNIKHHLPSAYAALKRSGLLNWSLYLNLYDILFLVATRN